MRTIWLSHPLSNQTPLYGGGDGIEILKDKSISNGDSCNTTRLCLPGHAGTHVDLPRHFIADGKTLDDFPPVDWIFDKPKVVNLAAGPGALIGPAMLAEDEALDSAVDMLILRTGFERFRKEPVYWQNSPGLQPDLADYLSKRMPNLRAIGVDFISISSLSHRETGRAAHRALLGKNYLLFEDMALSHLGKTEKLHQLTALPLRVKASDGVPCTIIGTVG